MRRTWHIARSERDQGSDLRAALFVAPFVLLFVTLLAVKSAHSSASSTIDDRVVLENLKRRIAEAAATNDGEGPAKALTAAPRRPVLPELREVREIVHAGDTLAGMLRQLGLGSEEVTRWSEAARRHVSLSHLQPGHRFTFLLPSGTDHLAGLQYEVSAESTLVMREDSDEITAQVERAVRMTDKRVVTGVIESSLYGAATRRGVPDSVVSALVDIFGWEIDFTTDLHAGDTFRVAYEERRDTRGRVAGGRVEAAELVIGGKRWAALYFEADDDGGNYYTPDGNSLGRAFLRYPLEFTRISSQFTSKRFHPLLGIRRPHLAVDFAAPMGTPVRAIASGRVEYAGWYGSSGHFIRIEHESGLESSYSHLLSIAAGVRNGARVQVGQVIGKVGASGLATGPHLHFALYRNGVYVNPMTVKLPVSAPLAPRYMSEFAQVRDQLLQRLASAPLDGSPAEVRVASARSTTRAD
jgi:murein DD-endopeptidase MepM/ murein hydrolase activator NlpD